MVFLFSTRFVFYNFWELDKKRCVESCRNVMGMLAAATVTLTAKKLPIMYMLKNTTSGRSACLKRQSKIMNPIIQLF
jgi:hypothetical protein